RHSRTLEPLTFSELTAHSRPLTASATPQYRAPDPVYRAAIPSPSLAALLRRTWTSGAGNQESGIEGHPAAYFLLPAARGHWPHYVVYHNYMSCQQETKLEA